MDQKLKLALIFSLILNSSLVLSGFYKTTYDSYTHIFFADHYERSWFNTWEPKWFGGFSVTSYPPLSHQVLALIGYVSGLEWAYIAITLFLTLIFPIASYKFSGVFVKKDAAGYSAIISVFLPSILTITYVFGQLPTLFSMVAILFMIYYLSEYFKEGKKNDFIISCCLLGTSISAHHFTTFVFLPTSVVILIITHFRRGINLKKLTKRVATFVPVAIVVLLTALTPFLIASIEIDIQPISHITRTNLFTSNVGTEVFFLGMYGSLLLIIPLTIFIVKKNKEHVPLFALASILFILGLGGTTILPKVIFGELWLILTYERFALWSSVTFLPLCGLFFSDQNIIKKNHVKKFCLVFLISLIILGSYFGNNSNFDDTNVNLSPLKEFLSSNGNSNWRYLTLGFGDSKMQELSVYTNATTLDGYYFLGRTIPVLANSGIGTLDSAKFYGDNGLIVLNSILSNAEDYNIKWIFCNDPFYYEILIDNNFQLVYSQDITNDGRFHGVTIWEKNDVPPLDFSNRVHQTSVLDYLWGVAPMTFLILTLAFVIVINLKNITQKKGVEE